MTFEDLSSASASRSTNKMMHDVHSTQRIRHPPRPDMPLSGRENLDSGRQESSIAMIATAGTPEEDDIVVETRQVAPTATTTNPLNSTSTATPPKTTNELVEDFMRMFKILEPKLFQYLNRQESTRLRLSTLPPQSQSRTLYTHPEQSAIALVVISVTLTVLFMTWQQSSDTVYRGTTHTVTEHIPPSGTASSSVRAVDKLMNLVQPE